MAATPPAPARRPFPWKRVGIAVLILAALYGAAEIAVRSLAARRWTAMKAQWQTLLEEARTRGVKRPALRGEPLDGNAWDDYGLVLQEVRGLYDLESRAAPNYLRDGSSAQRGLVVKVLDRHPVILDGVRRGARRANVNLALDWKEGALSLPSRHGTAIVADLAVCQSRFLADAGRPLEAAEFLLDACRFAGDLDHPEDMVPELEDLATLLQSGRLSAPELLEVGRELEILDRSFPRRSHRAALDFLAFASLCIKTGGSVTVQVIAYGADPEDALWRYGYSGRLMKTYAFDAMDRAVRQLHEADERPWSESRDLLKGLTRELSGCRNPVAQAAPDEFLGSDLPHRGHRAQLRLLRVAAHYRATGELLALDDPFGEKLLVHVMGDTLRVWSVGAEGKDHNGNGAFAFDREGRDAKDIVLEVRR